MMGDEQIAEAFLFLQRLEQVHDLGADRDVERGDRLVEDDQARSRRDRARDRHALALAAAELVREIVDVLGPQADMLECRLGALAPFLAADARIQEQRLGDEIADPQARIHRAKGVLEDGLDRGAIGFGLLLVDILEVPAVPENAAAGRQSPP